MSSTPREIGTLIVVILKARHLPNKRHIGKQDPYCLVELNGDKRRTKAIKRGGQHPEWDEEVRFTLYEDTDDVLARTAGGDDKPPTPPPKEQKLKIKGGKSMALACYADDAREPDLIGEATVDLTEVLTKGETDEWFPLMHKEKFAGEVYLELTFWSNEPAPEKKVKSKASTGSKQYGGPGSFTPARDGPPSGQTSRIVSTSALYDRPHNEAPDSLPQSLRASNSLAQLDLYVPPYEQRRGPSPTDNLANDFGQLGLADNRRRESYPPPTHGHRPSTSVSYSTTLTPSSFYQPGYPPQSEYDQQQPLYPSPYDPPSQFVPEPASYPPQPTPSRGPRYSIPATSSGFMPIQSNPPTTYNQPLYNPSNFASHPPPVQQPSAGPYPQPSSFHPLPQPPFQYPQYGSVTPAPPQTFGQPVVPPPLPVTPQPHPQYQQYHTPSPSHGESSPISSLSSSLGAGSRPLPQPVPTQQLPFPPPATNTLPPPVGQYGVAASNPYASVPPPPPLPVPPQAPPPPVQSYQTNSPSANQNYQIPNPGPPPPLPPSSQPFNNAQRRRLSLPQPPINMQQALQNIPPPPPLPNSLPHPPSATGPSTPPSPSQISNYTQPPYQGHPSYLPPPSDQQWQQPQAYPQSQWT